MNFLRENWNVCKTEDFIAINRCFKCFRYNHKAADCENGLCCFKCAGEDNSSECNLSTQLKINSSPKESKGYVKENTREPVTRVPKLDNLRFISLQSTLGMAAVAEWYRYRIVACVVTSSSPVPLKSRRAGQRCTLNLSRAETSSRWCGVVVRRGGASSSVIHVT
ncbi:uncharacterized protein TNCV_3672751 [Trichonephila clavipes]|nr:uncharacterized protein TNCV_3672751 [Trichonephila clavipes]